MVSLKNLYSLQNLPDDNIAKQCLKLLKDMAEKNQPGISKKIKTLCDEYSCSTILNENNGKTLHRSAVNKFRLGNHRLPNI